MELPQELEEQAMLHALGILDPDDRGIFMARLQGESHLLRQAAAAYQAATYTLAVAVAPVTPPAALRDRIINQVASEAARESEQFELAANTLALGAVPVKPRDLLRERLISRIEGHRDIRLDVTDSAQVPSETPALVDDGGDENKRRLSQEIDFIPA